MEKDCPKAGRPDTPTNPFWSLFGQNNKDFDHFYAPFSTQGCVALGKETKIYFLYLLSFVLCFAKKKCPRFVYSNPVKASAVRVYLLVEIQVKKRALILKIEFFRPDNL